ncbi:hypothetical protein [Paenibacillus methanolicus]|uniref:Uncharacterized protein n=1 Tax=Paenibacillus methanolicus TaxID=582686 RepID=A0A5S5BXT8_9BACL|nr:hypothetical protein [Paenibacillus methanolicus]TYP71834.1 hypothetical protein BCM02_109112 [Paenibacillus methanolicus]
MSDSVHQRLIGAKERVFRLQKAQRRKEELQKRLREQERLIMRHEMTLEAESPDYGKLLRLPVAHLFQTLLRSEKEQLKPERRQALAAALQLQAARQLHADTETDLHQVGVDLSHYRNAAREYDELMAEKEALLRTSPTFTYDLAEMDESIATQAALAKELQETCAAGRRAVASLEDVTRMLGKAERWGGWDAPVRGGFGSKPLPYNDIDEAKSHTHHAQHLLAAYRDELAEVKRTSDLGLDPDGLLRLTDEWIDGLITDWIDHGRLLSAVEVIHRALQVVRGMVGRTETAHAAAESQLASMKIGRLNWIEGRELA